MALREQFEATGNWLFRWRSYLPILLVVLFLASMGDPAYLHHDTRWDFPWEMFCLAVSFLGVGFRGFTVGYTPKGTSGRNTERQVADSLNTTGAYSIVRNPLYVGNFFVGLGVAMFAQLWWLVLVYVLIFWLYYERIIYAEEAFLRSKFGQTYLEWASRTPAFLPRFSSYVKPDLPFSFRNVLRREYNGLLAVVVSMFVLEVGGDLMISGEFTLDIGWIVLLSVTFVLWVVLRSLKKYTTVLKVEGR